MEDKIQELVRKSMEVKKFAYCRYSNFQVGAALLGKDGKIYTGCNVENCAYPTTTCAERVAVGKAVSEGCQEFEACAVSTNLMEGAMPCGQCRQCLVEFGVKTIYSVRADGTYKSYSMDELLPYSFTPKDLEK